MPLLDLQLLHFLWSASLIKLLRYLWKHSNKCCFIHTSCYSGYSCGPYREDKMTDVIHDYWLLWKDCGWWKIQNLPWESFQVQLVPLFQRTLNLYEETNKQKPTVVPNKEKINNSSKTEHLKVLEDLSGSLKGYLDSEWKSQRWQDLYPW